MTYSRIGLKTPGCMQLDLYHSKPIELTEKCLTFVQQTLQKNLSDAESLAMRDYCDLAEGIWQIIQTAGFKTMSSRGAKGNKSTEQNSICFPRTFQP